MLKKLSILSMVMFFSVLMAGSAFAQALYKAGSATMSLDLAASPCETRTIAVDGSSFGTSPLVSGGFLITLSDIAKVNITTCQCYDGTLTPAVWDNGVAPVFDPIGYPGAVFVAAANLGAGVAVPSANILICDVQFCGTARGDSKITVQTVPEFDTWVAQDFKVYDSTVEDAEILVEVTGPIICGNGSVEEGEECDDGNTANGDCCSATCDFDTAGSSCEDDEFCTDGDTCDGAGECLSGMERDCGADKVCDEVNNECIPSPCTIVIEPPFATAALLGTVNFEAVVVGTDGTCVDPCYTWEIASQGSTGSQIEKTGGYNSPTADYTAGTSGGIDIITVKDPCNYNIRANAQVSSIQCEGEQDCDDNNACTTNACPTEGDLAGYCVFTAVEDETPCDDGLYCTQNEQCIGGICGGGTAVECPDDEVFCNGTEYCVEDTDAYSCESSGDPCISPQLCNEETNECKTPITTTTTSTRPPITTTTSTPVTTTTVEPTTTTTSVGPTTTTTSIGPTASIEVVPASVFQSRWFFLPRWLRIEGTNTNFVRRESAVTFEPANAVLKFPPFVLDSDTIVMWVIIMPQWLTGEVDNVDVTVITGSESAAGNLEIQLLPFFLEEKK